MQLKADPAVVIENNIIHSEFLDRNVKVDFFLPPSTVDPSTTSLLLINDGQCMRELGLKQILDSLNENKEIKPLLCVAIHASEDRKMEYGTAIQADYLGRGAKAGHYTSFILRELLPLINDRFGPASFDDKAFAGFSLGGLMALDIGWNYPEIFSKLGVFSGSLWWRMVSDSDKLYDDKMHRIMHQQIRNAEYKPGLKFYFTTGSLDETNDRNKNGIIDSIDDTLSLIEDLENVGYKNQEDICYINYEDGKHDIATWARAMPGFLKWGWGVINN